MQTNTMVKVQAAAGLAGTYSANGKIRVAAYCRVSTQSKQQETSYEAQCSFYTKQITAASGWELAGIYADEGITGTAKRKRKAFLRMLADCERGKIDYIITKSISRFARNTLDCIAEVRHLQSLGVQIYFEENNIDTGLAYSEMLLTVLAAFAQEESRSLSENVKWSIRHGYKEGRDRWVRIYGYEKTADGTYQINEAEAAVVRKIFTAYESGSSMSAVGKMLEAQGICTPCGKKAWSSALVASVLENEKYAGDIRLQKFYTKDFLSHRAVQNKGELDMPYLHGHHAPIISRKTFERVCAIRRMNNVKNNGSPQYPFGTKLICPHCGQPLYKRKLPIQHEGSGWVCEKGSHPCRNFILRSEYIEKALLTACAEIGHAEFKRVDYWWVDEFVEQITFGIDAKTGESDHTMLIKWRDGTISTAMNIISRKNEHPEYVAGLYRAWLLRRENGTLGLNVRTKGSRVVNGAVINGEQI